MSSFPNSAVGITIGDPAGIGPEIIAKSLAKLSPQNSAQFIIIGQRKITAHYWQKNFRNCSFFEPPEVPNPRIYIGQPDQQSARCALANLNSAIHLLKNKVIKSLITAPLSKEGICKLGINFLGHTEYIAHAFGVRKFGMMFVADQLKTMLVTRHIPLKNVVRQVTPKSIFETIELTDIALKNHFHIKKPRIGVCGINPHAGEGGHIGNEDVNKVLPAIKSARKKGVMVYGPLAADTLFYPQFSRYYDAIIAMYHDQGLIGIKALYFRKLVNLTVGLPFIRTSPAHGTAFDIAGKNKADESSMTEAIRLAIELSN